MKVKGYGLMENDRMKIVERYPLFFRVAFQGWVSMLFVPLRAVLALIYAVFLMSRELYIKLCGAGKWKEVVPTPGAGRGVPRIISVGNIEVGGTGKTPLSIKLAVEMMKRGKSASVVMRGYGRRGRRPVVLPSVETKIDPSVFPFDVDEIPFTVPSSRELVEFVGDEALIYRSRGIPVVVDVERSRGIEISRRFFGSSHIILDDAFQNRRVHRDCDIALIDYSNPLGNGCLIPLGSLREPPSALKRADAIVATRAASSRKPERIGDLISGKHFFTARFRSVSLVDSVGREIPLSEVSGRKAVVFSAVARPESFESACIDSGFDVVASVRYMDHHRYTAGDIGVILAEAVEEETLFITTEKDIYKVADIFPFPAKLFALRVDMEVDSVEKLIELCIG